jgi:hypothetical protein
MFKNVFEVKPREKKIRTTLEVVKKDRVTKLLLPDNSLTLTKEDKVICVALEDGRVCLTKVKSEYPTTLKKNSVLYNVGDNSINSAPIAKYLQDLFGFTTEEFTLNAIINTIDETEVLILNREDEYVDTLVEESINEEPEYLEELPDEIDIAINEYDLQEEFL